MFVKQLKVGDMLNFAYLLGDESSGFAAVVDPAWEPDEILKAAQAFNLKVVAALLTHTHFDHCNGLETLYHYNPEIVTYVQKEEAVFSSQRTPVGNITVPVEDVARNIKRLTGRTEFAVGNIKLSAIPTPGHSPGSQCFHAGNCLFTGDTLFIGGCGRCDLPGSDTKALYNSMLELRTLPPDTILYPGHDYGEKPYSTLQDELQGNSFLGADSLEYFLRLTGCDG